MNLKKIFISCTLGTTLFLGSIGITHGQTYTVQSGDAFWKIAYEHGVSTKALLEANDMDENTIIYPGQNLIIPVKETIHTVQSGDTYWTISQKYGVNFKELLIYNGADENTWLNIGDKVKIPSSNGTDSSNIESNMNKGSDETNNDSINQNNQEPYVTYMNYTVKSGDDPWKLSIEYGVPMIEILKANNMNEKEWLNIGDVIKIPVHHVPVKATPGAKYGENLDWWTGAQYVVPIGAEFTLIDFATGKRWKMKRTIGANHADCEPLTKIDTAIMKEVWGGVFSWERRPVIVEYNGRKIAASAATTPHSIQYITNNNFDGHMDLHFLNSTRHKDGEIDWEHQKNIKIAAGIK
ncbi:LysM peptidoglycan-binding domain-containing protein [Crassaminicella profunda]|uniref:LysM peptidoglycan-binding domain-containing protein n=1 Tax=Crassaminicella profunda TaxID=1286698 RepID=UPI001CA676D9|nr:LysM peptidoglycan-binding domain-containing protein [Crassaminicella profunda]QZY55785.1 LysM peptidoglycan-binding domain-containing protein [Crassaminicella profunda]